MSRKTIRVLIVDDHAIVREGYRALLAKHEGLMVVGEACDAASAYQCYKDYAAGRRHHGHLDAGPRRHRRDRAYPRVRCLMRASSCSQCIAGPPTRCRPSAPGPKGT